MKTATTANLITCFSLIFSFGSATASDDTLRTVALSGNGAPGTSSGVSFASFVRSFGTFGGSPFLNNAGQVAFNGFLTGPGVDGTNERGIWSEGDGNGLELVARAGNAAPGTNSGVNFSAFLSAVLNDAGQTAFQGGLDGVGVNNTNDRGIWSEGAGSGLALVAREGNMAPGTSSGVNFSAFGPALLNDAGQTAFRGGLAGAGVDDTNDSGIWSEGAGSGLALVAREGNMAPGAGSGGNFGDLLFSAVVLNDAGQTAFSGGLIGAGVDDTNDRGIWSEGGGNGLALIVREGDAAPGTGSGINFGSIFSPFFPPVINNEGQIAFSGVLTGAGVDSTNDRGIWSEGTGSGLALVARSGNTAPGTSGGTNFSAFFSNVLNGAGQTAFFGVLTGPGVDDTNNFGLWSEGGGNGLELIARTGNAAPGTSSGVDFSNFTANVLLNDAGQTAFLGVLAGTGVDDTNDFGIWAEDLSGILTLIVREGDQLDVDDGPGIELRTISFLGFPNHTGNEDGRPSGFNDLGQLAFSATFTDGSSGVFVSDLAAQAIPEPSSFALMLSAFLGLSCVARRRLNLPRGTASHS